MDQMPDIKDGQTNDCKDRESLVMALVTLLPFMSGRRRFTLSFQELTSRGWLGKGSEIPLLSPRGSQNPTTRCTPHSQGLSSSPSQTQFLPWLCLRE